MITGIVVLNAPPSTSIPTDNLDVSVAETSVELAVVVHVFVITLDPVQPVIVIV